MKRFVLAAAGLVAALVVGYLLGLRDDERVAGRVDGRLVVPVVDTPGAAMVTLEDVQTVFRAAAQTVLPSVVQIDTTALVSYRFGRSRTPTERPAGTGSGVLVHRSGSTYYVLTNRHVIENATSLTVTLADGTRLEAEVAVKDEQDDLALIAFRTNVDLKPAPIGDSDNVQIGDFVLAIGSPYGFQSTVTSGISRPTPPSTRATPAARSSTCWAR
jgi:S1-C subfamily serine protease